MCILRWRHIIGVPLSQSAVRLGTESAMFELVIGLEEISVDDVLYRESLSHLRRW
jgi:hypothetical protein